MDHWVHGKIPLNMEVMKRIREQLPFNPASNWANIPSFHYSTCEAETRISKIDSYSQLFAKIPRRKLPKSLIRQRQGLFIHNGHAHQGSPLGP